MPSSERLRMYARVSLKPAQLAEVVHGVIDAEEYLNQSGDVVVAAKLSQLRADLRDAQLRLKAIQDSLQSPPMV